MPLPQELEYWLEEVSIAFPKLSKPQAQVLGMYSYGMGMTKQCGQTIVAVFLSVLLHLNPHNVRQRLKEFTYEAERKRGEKRCELPVEEQFEDLLKWIVAQWRDKKQIVLGVDVTYVRDRHTILTISVLYGQTGMPVAWEVIAGNTKGEWHPLWVALLDYIAPALPKTMQVLVLFDRGLYSKRLFTTVRSYGWHPFMRVREQGFYKRHNSRHWQELKQVAFRGMEAIAFKVQCFKGDSLEAYLWVQWEREHNEACLLVSDLPPQRVKGNPYPLRMWIEASFKDWKRGGLHLEQSKIRDPRRLSRLLFVLAVALVHLIRLGNAVVNLSTSPSSPVRRLSLVTLGWIHLLVATIHDLPLNDTYFHPYLLPPFRPPKKTYP